MKKSLPNLKTLALVLAMVLLVSAADAATRYARSNGNWNATTTWSTTAGGPTGASVPVLGDDVIINNGITVTVTVAAQCNSIVFASASGTVTVNSGITLDVTTSIALQNLTTGNTRATLAGAGTINCASLSVGGTITAITGNGTSTLTSTATAINVSGNLSLRGVDNGANDNNATLNFQSGTITVDGSVVLNEDAGSTVNFTMNSGATTGTLVLTGATPFTITGAPTFTPDGGGGSTTTVRYSGAAQTVLAATYRILELAGSGSKTLTGVTVNGKISLQGTATAGTTFTYSTAILEYKGSAAQTTSNNEFPASTASIDEVIIDNAAGVTLNAAKTLNGDLTLTNGALTAGTNLTMATGTTINRDAGSITGTIQGNNAYNVNYTGDDKTTGSELSGTGFSNVTVNLNAGKTVTLDQNRAPDGSITVTAGTLDLSSFTFNRSAGTGTFTVSNGATLKIGGTNTLPTGYNYTLATTSSTVDYDGTTQTVGNATYAILVLSGSNAKNFPAARTVNVKLSMQGTATATGTTPSYGASASLEYKGAAAQTTSNVEFPAAMGADLIIDNANGVTLNGIKNLSASLTLTDGVLFSTSTAYINFPDGFKTITGGTTTSYVDGPIRKTGNDAGGFTFPVGRNGVYAPLTITSLDNNADVLECYYHRESATALGPIDVALNGLVDHVSNCEYWELNEIADAGGANSVNVTVGWSAQSGCGGGSYVNNPAQITLVHFNTGTGKWDTRGGVGTGSNTTGTVTRNAVNTFSPFTLGAVTVNGNPLPVKFSDIKAYEKGTAVQIDWTNETEENLLSYVVERSSNGVDFNTVIATVSPRSNASDRQSYTVFDASPLSVNFYRIKAVELIGGKTIYSKLVKVSKGGITAGLSLYPNPVKGNEVTIGFTAIKGQYTVRVINAAGQNVYSQTVSHPGGTISQTLSLPSTVKAGVYNLLISGDNYRETKMFVVQ